MTITSVRRIVAVALLLAVVGAGGAVADDAGEGRLTTTSRTLAWSGGPFYASVDATYGIGTTGNCRGPEDPVCDNFRLSVDAPTGWWVLVSIAVDEKSNDFDLYVFDAAGVEVARSGSKGDEAVAFQHRQPGRYTVSVAPYTVQPGATYDASARLVPRAQPDSEAPIDCGENIPQPPTTATDGRAALDVLVVLDRVPRWRAGQVLATAKRAYQPLGIDLRPHFVTGGFRRASSDDAWQSLHKLRRATGGRAPQGMELVLGLTPDLGDGTPGGTSFCIGGIRDPRSAFAVAEVAANDSEHVGSVALVREASAITAAHELGHLLGAQHRYGNCVEGLSADEVTAQEVTPCTLMDTTFPYGWFVSLRFSELNAAIVRSHAFAAKR